MLPRTDDVHMNTVMHDPVFQAFMDRLNPSWREWPDTDKRMAAKHWNFPRLYGMERLVATSGRLYIDNKRVL